MTDNLPDNWASMSIDDSVKIIDYRGRTPPYSESGIPHLRSSNIGNFEVIWDGLRYVTEETYKEYMTRGIPVDTDILFTTEGPLGKVALAPNSQFSLAQRLMILRANESILVPKYLMYQIANPEFQARLKVSGTGTTVKGISARNFKPLKVYIAPLKEQHRIVTKIEALTARSRKARQALDAIPALLDQFRQSVLAAAFRGDLTADWRAANPDVEPAEKLLERIRKERRERWEAAELEKMKAKGKVPKNDNWKEKYKEPSTIVGSKSLEPQLLKLPEDWLWVRAEEVCDFITKGTTPSSKKMTENAGEIPFIKVYNLTFSGKLDFSINPTFIDRKTHEGALNRSRVFPGDVLMNIVGPPLGKVSIVPGDFPSWNMNQAIAVFRAITGVNNRFLCYYLLSNSCLDFAVSMAKATAGQFNLTLEICRNLPVPLPSEREQKVICQRIGNLLDYLDSLARISEENFGLHEKLDQSILAKAFRGELVPQDPNDEPASILLQRIQAEREKLNTKKKTKKTRAKKKKWFFHSWECWVISFGKAAPTSSTATYKLIGLATYFLAMKLPNPDKAIIPFEKLEGYSLNPNHSEGRHKATVFRSALGIGISEASKLRSALHQALQIEEAIPTQRNAYGQKYKIEFIMVNEEKSATVTSIWIIRNDESFPRLVTCYIP